MLHWPWCIWDSFISFMRRPFWRKTWQNLILSLNILLALFLEIKMKLLNIFNTKSLHFFIYCVYKKVYNVQCMFDFLSKLKNIYTKTQPILKILFPFFLSLNPSNTLHWRKETKHKWILIIYVKWREYNKEWDQEYRKTIYL